MCSTALHSTALLCTRCIRVCVAVREESLDPISVCRVVPLSTTLLFPLQCSILYLSSLLSTLRTESLVLSLSPCPSRSQPMDFISIIIVQLGCHFVMAAHSLHRIASLRDRDYFLPLSPMLCRDGRRREAINYGGVSDNRPVLSYPALNTSPLVPPSYMIQAHSI
jgi:hypothetical protein